MEIQAIGGILGMSIGFLYLYTLLNSSIDNTLVVYRYSPLHPKTPLFNISSVVDSNDNSFVRFEVLPRQDYDIFCLSEFEYRSTESQIFFNVMQIVIVSDDGHFCVDSTSPDPFVNLCYSIPYYASTNPFTGILDGFENRCIVLKTASYRRFGPVFDFGIKIARHVINNETDISNKPLIVIYPPPIDAYVELSALIMGNHSVREFQGSVTVNCTTRFKIYNGQLNFNFKDILPGLGSECNCSTSPGPICSQFHENLSYGYLSGEGNAVPYTHCFDIPLEKLRPYHDANLPVTCPCGM